MCVAKAQAAQAARKSSRVQSVALVVVINVGVHFQTRCIEGFSQGFFFGINVNAQEKNCLYSSYISLDEIGVVTGSMSLLQYTSTRASTLSSI